MNYTVTIEEEQRQAILLALAELALERPGWDYMLGELAQVFNTTGNFPDARVVFDDFKRIHADRVRAYRDPLVPPLVVANRDPDLFTWLSNASAHAGDFLKNIAEAGLRADPQNYPILRPTLLALKAKYPKYAEQSLRQGEVETT
jgi:hypothetical protein